MRAEPPFVALPSRRQALQTLMTAATTALAVPQTFLDDRAPIAAYGPCANTAVMLGYRAAFDLGIDLS